MKPTTIGILQADGSFFPVVEETQVGVKKLTLTAARPGQESVRIDIRSADSETEAGLHLGTLALQRSGSGDIELILDLDEDGRLTATAAWPQGTAKQSISVDLKDYRQGSDIPELESLDTISDILEPAEEELTAEGAEPLRSDREILGDDSLDSFELDELTSTDDPLEEVASTKAEPQESFSQDMSTEELTQMNMGESLTLDLPDFDSLDSWDEPEPSTKKTEIPLDSNLDWGENEDPALNEDPASSEDDFSRSQSDGPNQGSKVEDLESDPYEFPDLSMDDTPVLELSDLKSEPLDLAEPLDFNEETSVEEDFSFPDLEETPTAESSQEEMPAWEPELPDFETDSISEAFSEPKKEKPSSPNPLPEEKAKSPQVDRLSLVLSLITLGILVAVLLGLLFMNFMRPASPPALQPESFLIPNSHLALAQAPVDPLKVPDNLLSSVQQYHLRPGDESLDLERRFGPVEAKKSLSAWTW